LNIEDLGSINFYLFRNFTIEDLYNNFLLNITDKNIKLHKKVLCKEAETIQLNNLTLLQTVINDLEYKKSIIQKNITMLLIMI
jgi:hypothetical protein